MSYNSPFTGNVVQPTDVSYREINLTADLQLEWPINGTTTGDAAARIMEVISTSSSWKLYMPPANQTSVGTDAFIRNIGVEAFQVVDFDGNTIIALAAGDAKYIYVTNSSTTAGDWGIVSFGAGSSSADAYSLAGFGLKVVYTTLTQAHDTVTFSSNYTAQDSDRAVCYVWDGGAGTLTLPAAASLGNDWFILIRNGGAGYVVITPNTKNINGGTPINFYPS